jgi:hypothetical protein
MNLLKAHPINAHLFSIPTQHDKKQIVLSALMAKWNLNLP